MPFSAFFRPEDLPPPCLDSACLSHAELKALGARLDKIAELMEKHAEQTADLPHQVWERLVVEIRCASQTAAVAAWSVLRRRIVEEVSKWAWRATLGFFGLKVLEYLHTMISTTGIIP